MALTDAAIRKAVNDHPIFPPTDQVKIPPPSAGFRAVPYGPSENDALVRAPPLILLVLGGLAFSLVAGPVGKWETRLLAFSTFP